MITTSPTGSQGSSASVETLVEEGHYNNQSPGSASAQSIFSPTAPWKKHEYDPACSDEKIPSHKYDRTPGTLSTEPDRTSRRRWRLRNLLGFDSASSELRSTAWLDGLRGLAAFEVFIFHYIDGWAEHSRGYGQDGPKDEQWWRLPFIRSVYGSGDTAVCVFFAISGYVLTYKMLTMLRQNRQQHLYSSVASAMVRRGVRLYMPVIVESFILMALGRIGFPKAAGYKDAPTILLECKRWFWSAVHLLMPLRYPSEWTDILNIYDGNISWTIPLEYYGSMIVYATLMFFSRTRNFRTRMALTAAMVTTSFLRDDWVGAQFLLGMAFADYQLEREAQAGKANRKRSLMFIGTFVFGIYLSGLPFAGLESQYRLTSRPYYDWISQPLAYIGAYVDRKADRYLACLAGICILMGIGETPKLKKMMETPFVQYLGKISFGLYLCHIFLHAWLKPLDKYYFVLVGLDPSTARAVGGFRYFVAFCMMMLPATFVNFAAGSLFEKYLDQPSVKAAKLFESWIVTKD